MRIASVGHAVFAATMIALGIVSVIKPEFNVICQPVPDGVPVRGLAYFSGFIFMASGVGLLWQRTAALAARALLAFLLLWLLLVRVPGFFHSFAVDVYWPTCQTAVMVAAAWVLYAWFATDWDRQRLHFSFANLSFATGDKGLRIGQVLYGLAMIPFGFAHFAYLKPTADLVPSWLPWHLFWSYFFGFTFIGAGVGMLIGVYARLAVALSALQMGMFTVFVWFPVIAAPGPKSDFQCTETLVSWMLTAAAWIVADSYRGTPWLGVGKR